MKNLLQSLIIVALLTSCESKVENVNKHTEKQEPIEGLWQLISMEIKDSTNQWSEWRDGMKGYLLYDGKGHMALHIMPKDYEKTHLRFPNFTDTIAEEALKYLTNNYNYFGTYSINTESSIVTHNRISHSNPRDWGTTVKRRFSFSGDTLVVKPVEEKNAKLRLKLLKED